MTTPPDPTEKAFCWALQALALPADQQVSLFPDFADVLAELELDFVGARDAWLGSHELTAEVAAALDALNAGLETIADDHWTMEGLATGAEWENLRVMAAGVLVAMDWPLAAPPAQRGWIYVREGPEAEGPLRAAWASLKRWASRILPLR